ncbi:hypothetical protein [Silvibacterium dinghuense]|uniref:SPOR domain-containing protein n=1 Tax=Silvibacterium dinghuense TaxID=1560006 RepID=A0A4Q1SJ34_9BACT|nr:hypothetical protein [Silvibacterium dinghuense]RXS97641.1 hypothetical protein ESZ00_07120 [Silvibacterium dinghuense]GGH00768.1 hypothetical protein GCM10011586_15450 [Silvibacterium dinghuense]
MELWTEYEGTTIDGAFPLKRLLQPEGRSALFATSDGQGAPRILRLVESHFDDDEILARWRGVAALHHPYLLRIDDFGKVTLDETALVYAVMEPSDADLGEVLVNQRLSQAESRQLAESVASALEALHTHGFVHEHVSPASILAVGETVKLRSDCIREAPEGAEGQALKRRDLENLCTVLLQALTGQRTIEAAGPLPAPFDRIITGGLRGGWGAAEILAALKPPATAPAPVAPTAPPVSATVPAASKPAPSPASPTPTSSPVPKAASSPAVVPVSGSASGSASGPVWEANPESRSAARVALMAGGVIAVLLCLWLGWHILHHSSAPAASTAAPTVAVEPAAAPVSTPAAPLPQRPSAAHPMASASSASPVAASGPEQTVAADTRPGWRVIAYTYNHADQAQHKARTIAEAHADLQPSVFTRTGQAPFLVTLGGVMTRDQAIALAGQAHREGLPHDVYAQNYH